MTELAKMFFSCSYSKNCPNLRPGKVVEHANHPFIYLKELLILMSLVKQFIKSFWPLHPRKLKKTATTNSPNLVIKQRKFDGVQCILILNVIIAVLDMWLIRCEEGIKWAAENTRQHHVIRLIQKHKKYWHCAMPVVCRVCYLYCLIILVIS